MRKEIIELKVDGNLIDIESCPPNLDHMGCYLTGGEVDQRAICSYCWLTYLLESYHQDAHYGRLRKSFEEVS